MWPAGLDTWQTWALVSGGAAAALFARYALLVGAMDWAFRSGRPAGRFAARRLRLSPKPRKRGQTRRELAYAAATSAVFGVSTAVLLWAWQTGHLGVYLDVAERPLWYVPVSLATAMLAHETYYYWLHRWMHRPAVYPWLHRGHHDSVVTSGWTSFAFDPGEAVLQAAVIPVILVILPMWGPAVVLWLTLMTVSAIVNHLGVELYPRGAYRHWFGRQWIGATHHGLHHTRFTKNYGLYFTFWDRWMGTEAAETTAEFERATGGYPPESTTSRGRPRS